MLFLFRSRAYVNQKEDLSRAVCQRESVIRLRLHWSYFSLVVGDNGPGEEGLVHTLHSRYADLTERIYRETDLRSARLHTEKEIKRQKK